MKSTFHAFAVGLLLFALPHAAQAQAWPNRALRLAQAGSCALLHQVSVGFFDFALEFGFDVDLIRMFT